MRFYDDRLEIWSDGTLPFGLRPEDLKRDHLSRPRNPLIAEVFYRRGLVERWGKGTQRLVDLCVRAGHPEPEFLEEAGAVCVRFLPSGYIAPFRVAHYLTQRQRKLLQALAGSLASPFGELRAEVAPETPERTLRDDLAHLKRLGLINSRGMGRGAVWFLKRPNAPFEQFKFVRYFQSPLMRDLDRLEGKDADRFAFLNTASQKCFDGGLLVVREVFGIADQAKNLTTL